MGLAERVAFYGGLLAALGLLAVVVVAGPGTPTDPTPAGALLAAGVAVAALGSGAAVARAALA